MEVRSAGAGFHAQSLGAGAFGAVIGWIAYRTLWRANGGSRIADLVTIIAALGGAAVVNNQFAEEE